MQILHLLKNLLLILLLAVAGSGTVSAKVASGPQELGWSGYQGEPVFNWLLHQGKSARSTTGPPESSVVAKKADDTIFRMGTSKESKTRLGRKAQEAEDKIGIHGVSGSTTKPRVPCSSASCSALEDTGFKVTPTPTRNDPGHVTIELPKPVTKEVADKFNDVFGR